MVSIPVKHRQATLELPKNEVQIADVSQPLSILTVDDHPANRLLLQEQLTRLGHRVVGCENGEQALACWQNDRFDLVITDCNMPVMDGVALTRELRKRQRGALTILGLTANAQTEERVRCIAAGMDDCLFKPLRLPQLEILLRRIPRDNVTHLASLVNMQTLSELTGNNADLIRALLQSTRDENLKDLAQAERLLVDESWPELASRLHRLAGSSQIIGAEALAKSCRTLERQCEQGGINEEAFSDIKQQFMVLNKAIERYLSEAK